MPTISRYTSYVSVTQDWLMQTTALLRAIAAARPFASFDGDREQACALCGLQQPHPGAQRHEPSCPIRQAAQLVNQAIPSSPPITAIQKEVAGAIQRLCSTPPTVVAAGGMVVVKPTGPAIWIVMEDGATHTGIMETMHPLPPKHWGVVAAT